MKTPRKSSDISVEYFDQVVDVLETRLINFLCREARIGQSSRVTVKARISDNELYDRLARLRDHLRQCIYQARTVASEVDEVPIDSLILSSVEALGRRFPEERFARLQKITILKRLMMLNDELMTVLDLMSVEIQRIGQNIRPNFSMELLTPEEIRAAFGYHQAAEGVAQLVRLDGELRSSLSEIMALLRGYFHDLGEINGRWEKGRGRWIAGHLLGLAEGYKLLPTRNLSPYPESSFHSAADAVAIAIGRAMYAINVDRAVRQGETDWRMDPAVSAVLDELPRNRGSEFDAKITADAIIRKLVSTKDEAILQARQSGKRIGERDARKRGG